MKSTVLYHEDSRNKVFVSTLYEFVIKRETPCFYLIGPYFKKFSSKFLSRTEAEFLHYQSEIVKKDTHDDQLAKTTPTNLKRSY